jgi:nucleotide sugar dehydrogenase
MAGAYESVHEKSNAPCGCGIAWRSGRAMSEEQEKVCIIGLGYVGLTLAVVMAERGFQVTGVETDPETMKKLRAGLPHFHETNLEFMLRRSLRRERLKICGAIPQDTFDAFVVTVGTPLDAAGASRMDLVERVCTDLTAHLDNDPLVVLRSTVRLGTTQALAKLILDRAARPYSLAFCPERTLEGRAIEELTSLPQIVGGVDRRSENRAAALFQRLTPTIIRVSGTGAAELIKLLNNAYRDTLFAFGNEVAILCEKLGLQSHEVIRAANTGYPRANIPIPGFVGGPCLEKDVHILTESLAHIEFKPHLIQHGRALNESLVPYVFAAACDILDRTSQVRVISLLGMAFKGAPETDDLRGSPSVAMLKHIRSQCPGATLRVQDYLVARERLAALGAEPVDTAGAFEGADMVFLMNNNNRYRQMDIEVLAGRMRTPGVIYDAWGLLDRNLELPRGISLHVLGG